MDIEQVGCYGGKVYYHCSFLYAVMQKFSYRFVSAFMCFYVTGTRVLILDKNQFSIPLSACQDIAEME